MNRLSLFPLALVLATSCSRAPAPEPQSTLRIYITNEGSGDLTVIDGGANKVLRTVPLGKRPRGIQLSGDRLYVALSGSPFAPPGVDESKLPPPDRSADGIGVYDLRQDKLIQILDGGSDPEQFAVNRDGTRMYVANEDASAASILDLQAGKVIASVPVVKNRKASRFLLTDVTST